MSIKFSKIPGTGSSQDTRYQEVHSQLYSYFAGSSSFEAGARQNSQFADHGQTSSYWEIKPECTVSRRFPGDTAFVIKSKGASTDPCEVNTTEILFVNGYVTASGLVDSGARYCNGALVKSGSSTGATAPFLVGIAPGGNIPANIFSLGGPHYPSNTRFSGYVGEHANHGWIRFVGYGHTLKIVETEDYVFVRNIEAASGHSSAYYQYFFFAGKMEGVTGTDASGYACFAGSYAETAIDVGDQYHSNGCYEANGKGSWGLCQIRPNPIYSGLKTPDLATTYKGKHAAFSASDDGSTKAYHYHKCGVYDGGGDLATSHLHFQHVLIGYIPPMFAGQAGATVVTSSNMTTASLNGAIYGRPWGYTQRSSWYIRDDGTFSEIEETKLS
jgi:hypothetical protein